MTLVAPFWSLVAVSAVFGAMLGSFFNVCIYRLPKGKSIVFPPSACPHCQAKIAPYDNIPVLSWLVLLGRCRRCRASISLRYPVVEALTGLLFATLVWRFGLTWELFPALCFTGAMIVVTFIDYDEKIIPDIITLTGVPLGILASFLTPVSLLESVVGAALGFLLFLGIAEGYHRLTGVEGMGGGDIKLAAMLGAFLGWQGLLLTVFLASLLGAVIGLVLMAVGRGGRRTALPFGTFLAPVSVLVLLFGNEMIAWYRGFLAP